MLFSNTKLFNRFAVVPAAIAAAFVLHSPGETAQAAGVKEVVATYADIAEATYQDALQGAQHLSTSIDKLLAEPTPETLAAARSSWIAARVPYMQTEVYRFGNPIVDNWEGKVNAWPLDEGLIDYVDTGLYGDDSPTNDFYAVNIIANKTLKVGGESIDASNITMTLLADTLHEAGGIEANVATGYHAVEFLLWGQDLNGTGAGAGNRPASDFDLNNCTNGNCDRRATYLKVATELLIKDLEWIVQAWGRDGEARAAVTEATEQNGLRTIFTGLGSLSYGELAGERIKLGLMLHDPEEEHDCFADNTHNSHYYNAIGMQNVYLGRYVRTDGSVIKGPSVADLVAANNADVDRETRAAIDGAVAALGALKSRAETVERYDQMLAVGNDAGGQVVQAAVDALIKQARQFERGVAALQLEAIAFEGSDSLDNPSLVGTE